MDMPSLGTNIVGFEGLRAIIPFRMSSGALLTRENLDDLISLNLLNKFIAALARV